MEMHKHSFFMDNENAFVYLSFEFSFTSTLRLLDLITVFAYYWLFNVFKNGQIKKTNDYFRYSCIKFESFDVLDP